MRAGIGRDTGVSFLVIYAMISSCHRKKNSLEAEKRSVY